MFFKNGWGRYSWELLNSLQKKGIRCRVLIPKNSEVENIENVEVLKVLRPLQNGQIKLKNIPFDCLKVIKYARNCDSIHALVEPYALLAFITSKILRQPYYITVHGTFSAIFLKFFLKKISFSMAFKTAQKVFCVSNFTKNFLEKRLAGLNSLVIHNGINLDKFKPGRDYNQKNQKGPIILSVGILKSRKGFHVSIPAVAEVKKKYPDVKYYIVGNQSHFEYLGNLKRLVQKYNLENNVIFLENLTDQELNDLYSQADVFVLTAVNDGNTFEGFGLVYLEANALAKPVIGTLDCGAEDAIKDGYNGFLVPQNDSIVTAKAILKILDNSDLAQKMGENGRRWAEEHSWDKISEKYVKVYKER